MKFKLKVLKERMRQKLQKSIDKFWEFIKPLFIAALGISIGITFTIITIYIQQEETRIVFDRASVSSQDMAELVSTDSDLDKETTKSVSSPEALSDKIKRTFPEEPETMIAIAKAESSFRADAVNVNRNGTKDCGVFQVNEIHGYDCEWLKDIDNNLLAAREVYEKQGLTAWMTYTYAIKHNLPI